MDYKDIKNIIKQLCDIIREYKKTDQLIHPQNIRNELALIFGIEKNEETNIENLKQYFYNLCELVRLIEKNKPNEGQPDILVAPINLPTKFIELLNYVPRYNIYFDENFDYKSEDDKRVVDLVPPVDVTDILNVTYIPDSTNDLPTPYRYRYAFIGWYMDEALTDIVNLGQKLESNITLYAKWKYGKYMVSYETFTDTYIPPHFTDVITSTILDVSPFINGYTFEGWYKNNVGGIKGTYSDKAEINEVLTNNIILYAKYYPREYTITFDVRTEDNPYASNIEPITTAYYPSLPVLDDIHGYHFIGWTKDLITKKLYTPQIGKKMVQDETLYAVWDYKGFNVYFDTNSNGAVKEPKPLENQTIYDENLYPTLEWIGHKFVRWSLDREGIPIPTGTRLLSDVTVYAFWDKFTITFDSNGGFEIPSIRTDRIPEDIQNRQGQYITTRTGYTFDGWYTDYNLTNYAVGNKRLNSDITLYAKWIPNIYTVRFDNNGHGVKPDDRSIAITKVYSSQLPILQELGWKFLGWYETLEQANSATDYRDSEYIINQDKTLYAGWFAERYDIIFNTSIGEINKTLNQAYVPSKLELDAIVPIKIGGYEFQGWFTDERGVTPPLYESKLISDLYLYASLAKLIYKITFEENGGNKVDDILVPYGQLTIDKLPITTRAGYTFLYWYYLDASGIEHIVDGQNPYAVADNVTLYAKWDKNFYNVYINNGGATGGNTTLEYYTSTHIFLKDLSNLNLVKTNYYLEGWYLDSSFTNKILKDFELLSDVYVYAKWSRGQYNVNIKYQYPSGITKEYADVTFKVFEGNYNLSLIPKPKGSGYQFLGWSVSNSIDSVLTQNEYPITKETTFYGMWLPINYNIVFVENGGTTVDDLYDSFFPNELPSPPTKQDYIFSGWYLDANFQTLFNREEYLGTKLTQDITLYAKWEEIYYEITFYTGYSSITKYLPKGVYLINDIITKPNRIGYDFVGWYNTQENANLAEEVGRVNEFLIEAQGTTKNLYAGYKPQKYEIVYTDLRSYDEIPPWYHYYGSTTRLIPSYDDNDTFEGWYLNNNFVGNPITELGPTQFTDSIYLYGKWAGYIWERFTGEIALIASVDPATNNVVYQGSTTITVNGSILDKRNMDGYPQNWTIEKETSSSITLKAISNEAGSVPYGLDIKYGEIKNYVITFDSNGGSGTMESQRYETGKVSLNANTYTKEGYDFVGWNTAPDGSGTSFTDRQPVSLSSNITLYAQWKLKQFVLNYRISFQDKPNDTGTGHMDYYKLWINNVLQSPIESFVNPQRDITVTYGDKIQTWVSTYQGSNRADVIIFDTQGNQIHNSGTQHDVFSPELTIDSNIDVHFIFREWTNTDIGDQFLKTQTYWVCRITYKN